MEELHSTTGGTGEHGGNLKRELSGTCRGMRSGHGDLQAGGVELQGFDLVECALRGQLFSIEGKIQAADVADLDYDFALRLDGLLRARWKQLVGDIFAIGGDFYPGTVVCLDEQEESSRRGGRSG